MNWLGIDPGAKHAGVCLIDENSEVLDATTFTRRSTETRLRWVSHVLNGLDEFTSSRGTFSVAVEDLAPPRTHLSGKRASGPLTQDFLADTAVILGAVLGGYERVVLVAPNSNGSRENYPEVLIGRRPAALWPSEHPRNARDHEKSAYDVARFARIGGTK